MFKGKQGGEIMKDSEKLDKILGYVSIPKEQIIKCPKCGGHELIFFSCIKPQVFVCASSTAACIGTVFSVEIKEDK